MRNTLGFLGHFSISGITENLAELGYLKQEAAVLRHVTFISQGISKTFPSSVGKREQPLISCTLLPSPKAEQFESTHHGAPRADFYSRILGTEPKTTERQVSVHVPIIADTSFSTLSGFPSQRWSHTSRSECPFLKSLSDTCHFTTTLRVHSGLAACWPDHLFSFPPLPPDGAGCRLMTLK